ncbi:MAG: WxcM-like domain-containing protein [Bacteroidales bacterium]
MQINENIKEPLYLPIQSINDDRGLLIPFADQIDSQMIRRAYFVENYGRGVVRGLHYHKKEIKMFIIASGAAKFNVLKMPLEMAERNETEEIQKYCRENPESLKTYVMSSRHHALLVVPPLYANGWVGLEDHSVLFSLSNLIFEDAKNDDLRIDPYIIGKDKWEVTGR